MKIYTTEKLTQEFVSSPKESVINSILNFSKSYEVLKPEAKKTRNSNRIGVILN